MVAGIYLRVSTREQALHGYSMEAQQAALMRWAEFLRANVRLYPDPGQSGGTMARPGLARLLDDADQGKLDTVLIWRLDRLSRRVRDLLDIVERLEKSDTTLFSLGERLDLSSPFGRAALRMSATFAELERDTLRERSMLGKQERVRRGEMMCTGRPPYGYRQTADGFEAVEKQARTVQKVFALYCAGRSMREISAFLQGRREWDALSPDQVRSVLHRKTYTGEFLWQGKSYAGKNFPPLISPRQFRKAERLLAQKAHKRRPPEAFTLFCGACGCVYRKRIDRNSVRWVCAGRRRGSGCRNPILSDEAVQKVISEREEKTWTVERDGEITPDGPAGFKR